MKNAILIFLAFVILPLAYSQEPQNLSSFSSDTTISSTVPDTLVFNFDGREVKVPTVSIQQAIKQGGEIVITIRDKANENPPKSNWEWIVLVITILSSASGLAFLTNVRKVASDIVRLFGKDMHPVNFVIMISGAISAGITLLWYSKWDTIFFIGLWPTVFGITTFVYLKFLKPSKSKLEFEKAS